MNEIVLEENIENMIYEIRGKQVMLDADLAILYKCKNGTKEINQAVRNNPLKFPERFSFKLTDEESKIFLVKIFDQKNNNVETRGGKYKNPRVFTEQGVAMLSTILKSRIATETSIAIMDAFVGMRHYIKSNMINQEYINKKIFIDIEEHDNRIKLIENTLDSFKIKDMNINQVFYKGQIYDAYSCIIDIMNQANNEIILIDNYADKSVLDMISRFKCKFILITKTNPLISKLDLEKYNNQHDNLKTIYNNSFHDRFIILDRKRIYHLGASLNHAGSKTFAINKIEDNEIVKNLINKILMLL